MPGKVRIHILEKKTSRKKDIDKIPVNEFHPVELFENIDHFNNFAIVRTERIFNPLTDIYEIDGYYIVKIEIAGLEENQINIQWRKLDLIITGFRQDNTINKKSVHYHQAEIHYGEFEKLIRFPHSINPNETKVYYNAGFLIITIPKTNKSRTRTIPINSP